MKKTEIGAKLVMNNTLKAVHDEDLIQLLKSLDVWENVKTGQCRCFYCDRVITQENIGAILPVEQKIQFICDEAECYRKMIEAEGK